MLALTTLCLALTFPVIKRGIITYTYTITLAGAYVTSVTATSNSSIHVRYSPSNTVISVGPVQPSKSIIPSEYNFTTCRIDQTPVFYVVLYDAYGNQARQSGGTVCP